MTGLHWLNWSQPCLPQAAAWLVRELAHDGLADGRGTVCILPGGRAGRTLLRLLLEQCQKSDLRLIPPRILTPGRMMEVLLPPPGPAATTHEQVFAWLNALRQSRAETLQPLLRDPPAAEDWPAWHALASLLAGLHAELAGARVTFTDVADRAERMDLPEEADRWRAVAALHHQYERVLDDAGLVDPLTASWRHIREGRRADDVQRVVLIGVDLNAMQRRTLALFGDQCTALVHAPSELADRFDADGCVIPQAWADARIDIPDEQIIVADRPEDQSQAVLLALSSLTNQRAPHEVTIGLGDESQADSLGRGARWAGIDLHHAAGDPLSRSAPYRLLATVHEWLDERRFANLASLIRHPDIEQWITQLLPAQADADSAMHDWLTLLDRYFTEHLAGTMTGPWLGDPPTREKLKAVHDAVERLLQPLSGEAHSLADWCEPILQVLIAVYGRLNAATADDNELRILAACEAIRDGLVDLSTTHPKLQPRVNAADALRLVLALLNGVRLSRARLDGSINMLGWLELHLDTAPILIITGVNDGLIPQTVVSDGFLPDSLRRALGLASNSSRYARDAYLLTATLNSRPQVRLICGRVDASGDPLAPSRLLMACDDATLPGRVQRLTDAATAWRWPFPAGLKSPVPDTAFIVPPAPATTQALPSIRVTAFRDYLACPYRFWLAHVLDLEAIDDRSGELDPMRFGTLAHDVLHAFAIDPDIANSTNEERIHDFLMDRLEKVAERKFGRNVLPAVQVQCAQLESRLRGFARWQATTRLEGWATRHAELKIEERNLLPITGDEPVALRATIDRIDQHEVSGAWRIIDYKTSDSIKSPHKNHHGTEGVSEEWLDLQLPLYHYLARCREMAGEIELGYVVLPRDPREVNFIAAEWNEDHLKQAVAKAVDVVRDIRAGRFNLGPDIDSSYDAFARICQTTTFGRARSGGGEGEGEAESEGDE